MPLAKMTGSFLLARVLAGCSDMVTNISGLVLDEQGHPIKGAVVVILSSANTTSEEVTTQEDGKFAMQSSIHGRNRPVVLIVSASNRKTYLLSTERDVADLVVKLENDKNSKFQTEVRDKYL